MIGGGVSFQPGSNDSRPPQERGTSPTQNVQEAIKVLSLRLPKVVGARATAPQALLSAQGSGGNPRVDSVVNQVLARMFGGMQGQDTMPSAPVLGMPSHDESTTMPVGAPSFDGNTRPVGAGRRVMGNMVSDVAPRPSSQLPRIITDQPTAPTHSNAIGVDGGPNHPGGALAPMPDGDLWERLRQQFQPSPEPSRPYEI